MSHPRRAPRFRAVSFWLGCVLLTTLRAQVVLAEHTADSKVAWVAAETDAEVPPLVLEGRQPKPRYAGWLLGAYLVPPAVAVGAIAAESGAMLFASAALMWLGPTAVHLFAGEYGLAGRAALVLAFTAGGMIVGGLVGLGIGALIPEDQWTREEDPGLHRFLGADDRRLDRWRARVVHVGDSSTCAMRSVVMLSAASAPDRSRSASYQCRTE